MTSTIPRRNRRLRWAAAVTAALAVAGLTACSSSTPADPAGSGAADPFSRLSLMAPAAPGGGWDSTARAMGAALEESGQVRSVTVSNVAGAGGTVGLAQLGNDTSDSSLMVMGLVMVGAVATNESGTTLADVTPIARLTAEDEVVVVPAGSPYKSIDDLVTALRSDGGAVTVTGGSAGGTDHMVAGLLAKEAGLAPADLNYIPYSGGGESLAALLGNKVSAGISGVSEYAEQIKAGTLVALAVAGEKPVEGIDAPTLTEAGYDVNLINWRGVVAPGGISDEARTRLVDAVTAMHDSSAWQDQLTKNGWSDVFLAGDEFATYVDSEVATTTGVLQDLGLVK